MRAPRSCASPISASSTPRGLRIGKRPVARLQGRAEEVRELGERRTRHAAREHRRASATVSTTGAASHNLVSRSRGRGTQRVRNRALCATSTASPAKHEPLHRDRSPRRSAQLSVREAGDRRDRWSRERCAESVSNSSTISKPAILTARSRQICDEPGEGSRLEIDNDVGRVLEQEVDSEWLRQRDRVAVSTRAARQLSTTSASSGRGGGSRRLPEREEPARRLLGHDRPAPLLDEVPSEGSSAASWGLDSLGEHTFIFPARSTAGEPRRRGGAGLAGNGEPLPPGRGPGRAGPASRTTYDYPGWLPAGFPSAASPTLLARPTGRRAPRGYRPIRGRPIYLRER